MKIISIHRDTSGEEVPSVFTVGSVPMIEGVPVPDNPAVKSIAFDPTGVKHAHEAFLGPCYVVSFEDSMVKRVIPTGNVVEVAFELEKKKDPTKKAAAGEGQVEAAATE